MALSIVPLQGPRGGCFLISKVTLHSGAGRDVMRFEAMVRVASLCSSTQLFPGPAAFAVSIDASSTPS